MSTDRPPTIDPHAALRWTYWQRWTSAFASPWLHEEVAQRMERRLRLIVLQPQRWVHWAPLRGGLRAHALLAKRYPKAEALLWEDTAENAQLAYKLIVKPWWDPRRWWSAPVRCVMPTQPVQMLWSNMALHMHAEPQALMAKWYSLLDVDGFLMFSCLGPDTLRELRQLYEKKAWPPPAHEFTDMHDLGDMLVQAGFAEPVMDMQRIVLTFTSPESLLLELRELGRNLHSQRFLGLRGRSWLAELHAALRQGCQGLAPDGSLSLTFEIIYGHAFKPKPRAPLPVQTTIALDLVRESLRKSRNM